jgi:hypothetical protein
VGDCLIGIGVTHIVESLSRPPGPESFRALNEGIEKKMALRAFRVASKNVGGAGVDLTLSPLPPAEYSALVSKVSGGEVAIDPATIPDGTMVLSFLTQGDEYSLESVASSPGSNWRGVMSGARHWNVGVGDAADFWRASLPADDIGILSQVPPSMRLGRIHFGLSLLSGSVNAPKLRKLQYPDPTVAVSSHHFCLSGAAVGTQGINTPFPIGLRTEILFAPE